MGIKKVQFILGRNLDPEIKKRYQIADNEYAEIKIVNPIGGVEIRKVKSPVAAVGEVFKRKSIKLKLQTGDFCISDGQPPQMPHAVYVVTKSVLNNLFEEFFNPPGDASMFFEFTKYTQTYVYIVPSLYKLLMDKLKDDEEAFSYANSLISDGGLVMGNATFGNDTKDIVFLAHMLSINNSGVQVRIIKLPGDPIDTAQMNDVEKKFPALPQAHYNVGIFNLQEMEPIIKSVSPEFIKYWKG